MKSSLNNARVLWVLSAFLLAAPGIANAFDCPAQKQNIPVDDAEVLKWKVSTNAGYTARGHVAGPVTQVFPDHSGHNHFEISVGPKPTDVIEVVYNISFGKLPDLKPGMQIEACGDYITSNAPNNGFPASPSGAIIHWVHRAPNPDKHDTGFVAVNGTLYGQGNGKGN